MRLYLIGVVSSHVRMRRQQPSFHKLSSLGSRPNEELLKSFRNSFPESVTFADAEQMLTSEPPLNDDIVIVATPPFAHLEGTRSCVGIRSAYAM